MLIFLLLGIGCVFIGIAIMTVATFVLGGSGSFGGIILIGPIPILFGAGTDLGWLVMIGIIITIVSLFLFFLMNRHSKKN